MAFQPGFSRARDLRPMPPDFPKFAWKMNMGELRSRYHCGNVAIRRWRSECGVKDERFQPAPPPDDFREVAPLRTVKELRNLYKCGWAVISRWQKETGVKAKNAKSRYRKREEADEIALCLNCPFPECKSNCGIVRGC